MDQNRIDVQFAANTEGIQKGAEQAVAAAQKVSEAAVKEAAKSANAWASLAPTFSKVGEAGQQAAKKINDSFTEINKPFAKLQSSMLALTGLFAGGAAFKSVIDSSVRWATEAGKLSKALGINTEQASVLNVALTKLGLNSDQVQQAAFAMSRQINTNAQAFETLGVKVRDSNGHIRPATDLMTEVNDKLRAIHNPLEQNIAGMAVYGRQWQEIKGILKLGGDQLKEAEKRARELGLIVGPEGVAQGRQYQAQMREIGLIGQSLSIQYGNQLLPIFTKLGAWLGQEGPAMSKLFGDALNVVAQIGIKLFYTLQGLGTVIGGVAAAAVAALSGNFSGAKQIIKEMIADVDALGAKANQVLDNYNKPLPPAPAGNDDNDPVYDFSKGGAGARSAGADKSRMAAWEATLAERKAAIEREALAEGQYRQMSLDEELSYWQQLRDAQGLNAQERTALNRKTAETELALVKNNFEVKVATLQAEEAQYRNNTDEKLRIERQIQAMYAQGTKEYEAAAKKIAEIQRQANEQERQRRDIGLQAKRDMQLAQISLDEQAAHQRESLGLITHQELLQEEMEFENRRFAIAQQAVDDRIALAATNPGENAVLLAQLHAQLEGLQQQHALRMGQISGQAVAEQNRDWMGLFSSMQSSFASVIGGFLKGTQSLAQTVRGLFAAVENAIIQTLANIAARWLVQQITEAVMGRVTAAAQIGSNAAVAGSGAFAATAAIPFVGPELAPAAGAAAYAGALSYASLLPAAEQGFDVPRGMNPITQLHSEEMVLPAKHANVIRGMADDDDRSSAREINVTIKGAGAGEFFLVHRDELVRAIKQAHRNFAFGTR